MASQRDMRIKSDVENLKKDEQTRSQPSIRDLKKNSMLNIGKAATQKQSPAKAKISPFNKTARLPNKLGKMSTKMNSPITETTKVMNQTAQTLKFNKNVPKGSEAFLSSKAPSTMANKKVSAAIKENNNVSRLDSRSGISETTGQIKQKTPLSLSRKQKQDESKADKESSYSSKFDVASDLKSKEVLVSEIKIPDSEKKLLENDVSNSRIKESDESGRSNSKPKPEIKEKLEIGELSADQLLASKGFQSVATERVLVTDRLLENSTIEFGEGTLQEQVSDKLVQEEEKNTAGQKTEQMIKVVPSDAIEHVKLVETDENTTQKPQAAEQASSLEKRSWNMGHDPYD